MSTQERESMAIACCLICSLSDAMKDCKKCPFNAGLKVKEAQQSTRVSSNPVLNPVSIK